MLLWLRKILFYFLLVLYCILTPYTIMAGMGYVFQPSGSGDGDLLQKTGALAIETSPESATIWLNGKKFSHKTPAVISQLFPGEYEIRLEKKGHQPWREKVRIEMQKATRLAPVVLLPQHPRQEWISSKKFTRLLATVPDSKLFVLETEFLDSLTKIELLFGKETLIGKRIPGAASMKVLEARSVPKSPVFLFILERSGQKHFLLYDFNREKPLRFFSQDIDPKKTIFFWQPKKPNVLYLFHDRRLEGMDLQHENLPVFLISHLRGVGVEKKRLYYLKDTLELWEADHKGEEPISLSQKNKLSLDFLRSFAAEETFRIEPLKRELFGPDWFVFRSSKGGLASNYPPYRLIDKGVLGYQQASGWDDDRVLFWTGKKIGLFDFSSQDEDMEERWPAPETLYHQGDKIRSVFWALEDTHLLFQDARGIWLLELRPQAPQHARLLAKVPADAEVLYHERQKSIYYLNENHQLIRQKITG